ncbi:MAG TPA: hypothetical protein VFT31_02765 [Kribbella sp.]|nr:hypothetical protein [Kribbella sp.]
MNGYQPRPVTLYGVESVNGWPTKVYGLAVVGKPVDELVGAARAIAVDVLPAPESARAPAPTPRAAFVIAHQARPACFVLVYWWATPVDLSMRYFRSPLDRPTELIALPPSSVGCVWELGLAEHERSTWVRHLLDTRAPDLGAYLAAEPPSQV